MNGENYIHRMNCEFAGYADRILSEKGVTCTPTYWSERDDWTLAMVAAGLGFAFMPANAIKHPGVIGVPVVDPEFWRLVNLVTVRGRPHSPGIGALVREAMRKKWYGQPPCWHRSGNSPGSHPRAMPASYRVDSPRLSMFWPGPPLLRLEWLAHIASPGGAYSWKCIRFAISWRSPER